MQLLEFFSSQHGLAVKDRRMADDSIGSPVQVTIQSHNLTTRSDVEWDYV